MPDKYRSFQSLVQSEVEGRDFRIRLRNRAGAVVIIAPHGGGIEPGTSEVADAVAGEDLSFYAFEGIKPRDNAILHITSTRFDEPQCLDLVQASPMAISIHGEGSHDPIVFAGGRDRQMLNRVRAALMQKGFRVENHTNPLLQGSDQGNICNRAKAGAGIQLELSSGLRRSFFQSMSREGRQVKTQLFQEFIKAIRQSHGQ